MTDVNLNVQIGVDATHDERAPTGPLDTCKICEMILQNQMGVNKCKMISKNKCKMASKNRFAVCNNSAV